MTKITRRCKSPYCIEVDGLKGRFFETDTENKTVEGAWCPKCIELYKQVRFFTVQTVDMIRNKFKEYDDTELPKQVKLILTQFAREIVAELGEEL